MKHIVILAFVLWVGCTNRFFRSNDFGQPRQIKLFVGDFAIEHWVTFEREQQDSVAESRSPKKALIGDWYNGELIDVPQEERGKGGVGVKGIRRAGFSEIIGQVPVHKVFGLRAELVKALDANQVELAYRGSVPEYPFQYKDIANPFVQIQASQNAELILTGRLRINSAAEWLSSDLIVPADHTDSFVLAVALKNAQEGTIGSEKEMIVSVPFPVAVPGQVTITRRPSIGKDIPPGRGTGASTLAPITQPDQFPLDAPELKRVAIGLILSMLIEQAERM